MLTWLALDLAAVLVTLALVAGVGKVLTRLVAHRPLAMRFVRRLRAPLALLLSGVVTLSTLAEADVGTTADGRIAHATAIAIIVACGWLVTRIVDVLVEEWIRTLRVERSDNLKARTARTQLGVLRRLAIVLVGLVVVAATLWTFDEVRTLGASILASAGVLSVVAGIAAQSSLANLFAGLQLAFSAPLRFDDVVVVEGQWGRVEDISLTYVVVRTWDERRLILPCTWFTQHTFENWTRPTPAILAPVELVVAHHVDVDLIRQLVDGLVADNALWDRRTKVVQVTESSTTTLTVRVLLSARDASQAFDLRCQVREAVFAHLRQHHPEALPGLRLETAGSGAGQSEEIPAAVD